MSQYPANHMENRRRTGNAYGIDPNTGKHWSEGMPSQPSGIWAGSDGRGDVIRGGGLGGLLSRFDPRRMGGGFFGRLGDRLGNRMPRRPPPFFGGGQFGGRRPFPGMYRGMPTFMNRMRPPFFDRRQKRPFFGLNRRPPFGGGFRPPFFQQSRPSYNPIPDIDDDAFRQFRQRIGQRPPTAGEASAYQKNNNLLRQMDGTIFGQSNAPQIPQELIDAQLSSVQQGPPVAGGTGSLSAAPVDPMVYQGPSPELMPAEMYLRGGIGSIGGMMGATGGRAAPPSYLQTTPHTPTGHIARLSPEIIAQAKAKRMMMERR